MPAASSRRSAITSVPLLGSPVEMRLPFRSVSCLMPLASVVTTCILFGYSTIRVRASTLRSLNLARPLTASQAVSAMVKPKSCLPCPISCRLATDAPVTSAVASQPGTYFDRIAAMPPPIG